MSPVEIRERIAKLEQVTQARGATAGEEANAQAAIKTLREKLPKEEPRGPRVTLEQAWAYQNAWGQSFNQGWGSGLGGGFGYYQHDQEKETLRADNARLRSVIANLESRLAASAPDDRAWQALREEIVRILKQKGGLGG